MCRAWRRCSLRSLGPRAQSRDWRGRIAPELSADQRAVEEIKRENQQLRDEISSLTDRYAELKRKNDERDEIDIRKLCTPFPVEGADLRARQSLAIVGSKWQGLREGMFVLYRGGIAGQVQRAGIAGRGCS